MRLMPRLLWAQMRSHFHGFVQYPAYYDYICIDTIDNDVPWCLYLFNA